MSCKRCTNSHKLAKWNTIFSCGFIPLWSLTIWVHFSCTRATQVPLPSLTCLPTKSNTHHHPYPGLFTSSGLRALGFWLLAGTALVSYQVTWEVKAKRGPARLVPRSYGSLFTFSQWLWKHFNLTPVNIFLAFVWWISTGSGVFCCCLYWVLGLTVSM